jgi:mono/diheme cytochrome c family protein
MNHPTRRSRLLLPVIALGAAAAALAACRGERTDAPPRQFLPDMDDQQKFKPQAQTEFFADGRSMRPAVVGAVAFGRSADPASPARAEFLRPDRAFSTGTGDDGKYLDFIPPSALEAFGAAARGGEAAMMAMLARGQERFDIYCSVCHGYQGDGRGTVGLRWASLPPSYHQEKYTDRRVDTGRDGYLFHVVREGVYDVDPATQARRYRMPAYGHAINERDAWAIVAYLRALQASWTKDLASIPPDQRAALDRKPRPAAPPAAEPPPSPAPAAPKEGQP